MEVGYSRLVTISTDNMLATNDYRSGAGAHWTFLSDPGRKGSKKIDIAEYTDAEHNPMIPHVIVSNQVSLYSRSITATGFLADLASKSFGKTCVLC